MSDPEVYITATGDDGITYEYWPTVQEWARIHDQISATQTPRIDDLGQTEKEHPMQATGIKYPEITVQLTGNDGNAYAILGAVKRELRRHGVEKEEQDAYMEEATSGDYDHLLRVTMEWVDVA